MYRSPSHSRIPDPTFKEVETVGESIVEHFTDGEPVSDYLEIPYQIRNKHIYIPGKTRHGKSTLIHAMAYQDIRNGAGVCVIDPKGDLVESLLNWIPESRRDDCVYLSSKSPVPINFFDYTNDDEKETVVGDIKYVITRGGDAKEAPLMDAILTDLIYTLFNANENPAMPRGKRATFLDIYRFLEDPVRQQFIRSFVTDKSLLLRWDNNFPHPKERAPTITRMTPFFRNPSLRQLFDCPDPALDIAKVMDGRKILLVDLGGISESARIFATLLIAKIRQVAFRRASIKEHQRIPFFLYVDEFEFFQTNDFDHILSFAGGYGLRLTLANQFIGQLDPRIRDSIFGNVSTFIVFCTSPSDANYFKHITPIGVSIAHLPEFQALYKIARQPPVVKPTPAPPKGPPQQSHADYIRNRTLQEYSCKAAPLSDTSGNGKPDPDPPPPPPQDDAGRASGPRESFRSEEQRRRPPFTQKGTDQKRRTNYKPEP